VSLLSGLSSFACLDLSAVFIYEYSFICCACSKVVDLGLGGAGPGLLEPASDPMPTAASSPPVVPPVDAGAAAGRVHNIARNFAVYPIFRFYWRVRYFFTGRN